MQRWQAGLSSWALSKSIHDLRPQPDLTSPDINWHCRHAAERPIKPTAAAASTSRTLHAASQQGPVVGDCDDRRTYDPDIASRIDLRTGRTDDRRQPAAGRPTDRPALRRRRHRQNKHICDFEWATTAAVDRTRTQWTYSAASDRHLRNRRCRVASIRHRSFQYDELLLPPLLYQSFPIWPHAVRSRLLSRRISHSDRLQLFFHCNLALSSPLAVYHSLCGRAIR